MFKADRSKHKRKVTTMPSLQAGLSSDQLNDKEHAALERWNPAAKHPYRTIPIDLIETWYQQAALLTKVSNDRTNHRTPLAAKSLSDAKSLLVKAREALEGKHGEVIGDGQGFLKPRQERITRLVYSSLNIPLPQPLRIGYREREVIPPPSRLTGAYCHTRSPKTYGRRVGGVGLARS